MPHILCLCMGSSCWQNSHVRMRTKECHRPVHCCSKEGRNDHQPLTQEGVMCIHVLQVSQKGHLTPLQITSCTMLYAGVKMCWPQLFFVDIIIRCKIHFVFFYFRGSHKPQKYIYNEDFQIYIRYVCDSCVLVCVGGTFLTFFTWIH